MKPFTIVALSLLTLTACQAEPNKTAGGTAQGEVLPGAASDAMLPLDTLKSQAPLAPKSEGESGDKSAAKPGDKVSGQPKAAGKASDTAPAGETAPAAPPPVEP